MTVAEVTDREPGDIDWELVARLNLYEFLFEVGFANEFARHPQGAAQLAAFRDDIQKAMLERGRFAQILSDDQRAECMLHIQTVTGRFFEKTEKRRKELQQTLAWRMGPDRTRCLEE